MQNLGQVHFYTGNGKGKTTAAFGLALRAAGANKLVYIAQFVKSMEYSEVKIAKNNSLINVEIYGLTCFINKNPIKEDFDAAKQGYEKVKTILKMNNYNLVVLDEIFIAIFYKLLSNNDIIELIKLKPKNTELVLTGRYAPTELYKYADLITEMTEVKHYYSKGLKSRLGIEF